MCLNFPTHKILYNLVERLSDFIQLNRCLFQSLPLFQQPQSIFHMLFLESWNVIVCKFILREHQLPGPVDHRDGKCELGKLGCWRVLLPDWNQLVCVVLQVRFAKPERVWPRHCINPASKSLVEDELRRQCYFGSQVQLSNVVAPIRCWRSGLSYIVMCPDINTSASFRWTSVALVLRYVPQHLD